MICQFCLCSQATRMLQTFQNKESNLKRSYAIYCFFFLLSFLLCIMNNVNTCIHTLCAYAKIMINKKFEENSYLDVLCLHFVLPFCFFLPLLGLLTSLNGLSSLFGCFFNLFLFLLVLVFPRPLLDLFDLERILFCCFFDLLLFFVLLFLGLVLFVNLSKAFRIFS